VVIVCRFVVIVCLLSLCVHLVSLCCCFESLYTHFKPVVTLCVSLWFLCVSVESCVCVSLIDVSRAAVTLWGCNPPMHVTSNKNIRSIHKFSASAAKSLASTLRNAE